MKELFFNRFVERKKDTLNVDEYLNSFYKKVTYYDCSCVEKSFDKMLIDLFSYDSDEYILWHDAFRSMSYSFVLDNLELFELLVENHKLESALEANIMYKKMNSIVTRSIPYRSDYSSVASGKKELLINLNNILSDIKSDNAGNIVENSQEQFSQLFNEEFLNSYPELIDLYNKLYFNIKSKTISSINTLINKANLMSDSICDINNSYINKRNFDRKYKPTLFVKRRTERK